MQPVFLFSCFYFVWLVFVVVVFHGFLTISHFSITEAQSTVYPLLQMGQLMQKGFYIQLLLHVGLKVNKKVTWAIRSTYHVTISHNLFTFQPTMNYLNVNFVTWEKLIQKPTGNILTEDFRITVSRMIDARHVPQ